MQVLSDHKLNIIPKKILVIQLGDIGDVVWAISSFHSLKVAFPQTDLYILTRKPYGDLLLDDPSIKNVLQTGNDNILSQLNFLLKLRQSKFDLLFDLRGDDRGAIISYLSGVKTRCALFYEGWYWRNRAFTHLVDPPRKKEKIRGAAEQSLRIIRGFGIKEATNIPKIFVSQKFKDKAAALIKEEEIDIDSGFVTINPFSRWSYKEWGMDKWRHVVSFIWDKYKMPVLIMGAAEERKRVAELVTLVDFPVHNFAGRTNLRELAAILQISRLHIGVDSAAPHIAAAVGTASLTIYGPSDWYDWAPPGENNRVVLPDIDCSPCYKKGCNNSGYSECLHKLPAEKVIGIVKQMIDKNMQ